MGEEKSGRGSGVPLTEHNHNLERKTNRSDFATSFGAGEREQGCGGRGGGRAGGGVKFSSGVTQTLKKQHG